MSELGVSPPWQPASCSLATFTPRVRYVHGLENCERADDDEVDEDTSEGMVRKLFVNEESQLTPGHAAQPPVTPPGSQLRVRVHAC